MTERKPTARIAAFKGSGIRRVFEAARTLERSGVTITHMEIGRPDFNMELAEYLLREAHLAAVPGSEFGEPGPACASPTPPSTRPSPTAWRGWPRPWQRCQVTAPSRLLKKAHLG